MKKTKNIVLDILHRKDISDSLSELDAFPPKKILGPLFSAILNSDETTRWHAVTAMGHVAVRLAGQDPEQGRILMRRLMWSLNDESGGIGWGAPECMGEIMARHEDLANEFHCIFFSYLVEREDGADNYLEYQPLRRGAFWGLARLALERPEIATKASENALKALMNEEDPFILVCLCKYFQLIGKIPPELEAAINAVKNRYVDMYWDQKISRVRIEDVCRTP